jgi:hypothetical protein
VTTSSVCNRSWKLWVAGPVVRDDTGVNPDAQSLVGRTDLRVKFWRAHSCGRAVIIPAFCISPGSGDQGSLPKTDVEVSVEVSVDCLRKSDWVVPLAGCLAAAGVVPLHFPATCSTVGTSSSATGGAISGGHRVSLPLSADKY